MKRFVDQVLSRIDKLDTRQIKQLLYGYASESERLYTVLDSLTDGIIVTDSQHGLVLSNRPAQRLVAARKSGKTGMPVWQYIADSDISKFVKKVLEEQNSVFEQEFSIGADGLLTILSVNVLPLVRSGHIHGSLIQISDISDKRKKEAQLRRAENLATLTTLTAGVAHEIKNPLGSISIHIQLMQKAMRNKEKINVKYLKKYIEVVNEEVNRLNQIIVSFLFSTRPMDILPVKQDINPVVSEVLGFVKYELKEHNIALQRQLQHRLPQVMIDERYVKQALLNIIKNAISAMDAEKRGVLSVVTKTAPEHVEVQVRDTGVGIETELLEKLFEPYFTTKDFGSGLGLSLVYKIVKEHGGDVAIESSVGEGTCVMLSFPIPERERKLLEREDFSYADDDTGR